MTKTLKQKIEEAAERHSVDADACCECEAEESFKAGAQFMLGYILREIVENALQQEVDQFGLKKGNRDDKI